MLTQTEQARIEEVLNAKASYIASLEALACEAAEDLNLDEAGRRLVAALHFRAAFAKFSTFWFPSAATQDFVQATWPNLPRFGPEDFEVLVKHHFALVDGHVYALTRRSHDQGIDLWRVEMLDPNYGAEQTTVVQCKLYRGYVPVSEVRDFFGVMAARVAMGLFVTTGHLTAQAAEFVPLANRSPYANRLHVLSGIDLTSALEAADIFASAIISAAAPDESALESMRRHAHNLTWLRCPAPVQQSLL